MLGIARRMQSFLKGFLAAFYELFLPFSSISLAFTRKSLCKPFCRNFKTVSFLVWNVSEQSRKSLQHCPVISMIFFDECFTTLLCILPGLPGQSRATAQKPPREILHFTVNIFSNTRVVSLCLRRRIGYEVREIGLRDLLIYIPFPSQSVYTS